MSNRTLKDISDDATDRHTDRDGMSQNALECKKTHPKCFRMYASAFLTASKQPCKSRISRMAQQLLGSNRDSKYLQHNLITSVNCSKLAAAKRDCNREKIEIIIEKIEIIDQNVVLDLISKGSAPIK